MRMNFIRAFKGLTGLDIDENAMMKEQEGGKVSVLSMGPPQACYMLRECLAMGADDAYLLSSRAFGGADTQYLSYIADATGGKFLQSDSSAGLEEIYSEIGEYMVNDYILEFDAKTALEDFSRDLSVEIPGAHAIAESVYNVGVPYRNILDENSMTPDYSPYRQIGGSASSY